MTSQEHSALPFKPCDKNKEYLCRARMGLANLLRNAQLIGGRLPRSFHRCSGEGGLQELRFKSFLGTTQNETENNNNNYLVKHISFRCSVLSLLSFPEEIALGTENLKQLRTVHCRGLIFLVIRHEVPKCSTCRSGCPLFGVRVLPTSACPERHQ